MHMKLYQGSPETMEGREEREVRTYSFLDSLHIPYERTDHPDLPASSMEVCAQVDQILGVRICKNLFLCNHQETEFWLLIMPGDKLFLTKEFSKKVGSSRLSFAKESYMEKYLDLHAGSVSVLGLMNDREHKVKLAIDEDLLKEDMFGCHPCVNTSSLRFRTKDLINAVLPAMGAEPVYVKLTGER